MAMPSDRQCCVLHGRHRQSNQPHVAASREPELKLPAAKEHTNVPSLCRVPPCPVQTLSIPHIHVSAASWISINPHTNPKSKAAAANHCCFDAALPIMDATVALVGSLANITPFRLPAAAGCAATAGLLAALDDPAAAAVLAV